MVLTLCVVLVLYVSPRVGRSNLLVYVSICSLLGAFTVSSVKGLAIAIHTGETPSAPSRFGSVVMTTDKRRLLRLVFDDITVLARPLTWILLFTLIVSIVTQVRRTVIIIASIATQVTRPVLLRQVNYLNKSLDTFNTLLVYPVYYVLFTSVVLSTSVVLLQEWRNMAAVDVVTTLGAFLVIVVGVAMLHLFKELQVGAVEVSLLLLCPSSSSRSPDVLQITVRQLTNQLSRPVEREEPPGEVMGHGGGRKTRKEDKYELMDNVVVDSLPPMRDDGPRVFIIS